MKRTALFTTIIAAFFWMSACSATNTNSGEQQTATPAASVQEVPAKNLDGLSKAYFASGCFWCVEAIFESIEGVEEAISGYAGGTIKNPTYELVSSGRTRHAEAVEVYYDADIVSFETLLKVFFGSHDPTTPDRQGPDRGPQYRSVAFYQNESEKAAIEAYVKELEENKAFSAPIVTEVTELDIFYPAEDYHQDYERNNPDNRYVQLVSIPRLKRFQEKFPDLLKEQGH